MKIWFGLIVIVASIGFFASQESFADENITIDNFEEEFQLKFNQTAFLESDEIKIILLNVTDSRCPWIIDCVWLGKVTVLIDITKNEQNLGRFDITRSVGNEDFAFQNFDAYSLKLIKVEPNPSQDRNLTKILRDPTYIVTFVLSDEKIKRDFPSPRAQIENDIFAGDVICKEGLELILKSTDFSPACVKPHTAEKLLARGWGIIKGNM